MFGVAIDTSRVRLLMCSQFYHVVRGTGANMVGTMDWFAVGGKASCRSCEHSLDELGLGVVHKGTVQDIC